MPIDQQSAFICLIIDRNQRGPELLTLRLTPGCKVLLTLALLPPLGPAWTSRVQLSSRKWCDLAPGSGFQLTLSSSTGLVEKSGSEMLDQLHSTGVEETLKSIMIILSGSLNNAALYNRSASLMAETDKNNFPHSQQSACSFMQHVQKQQR